ncbi:DUF2971 domain-containing protein [Sphingomonas koreensis]|nr:DUF2971 domain-containing protein [Sphingomonas koreensis]
MRANATVRRAATLDQPPYHFDSAAEPILYHYTDLAGAKAIIDSQSFRLSEFTAMNDPSEFAFAKGEIELLLDRDTPHLDVVPHYALAHAFDDLEAATGLLIGSLTTRNDDLTQWRLYGDDGRGCVLGFDADYLEHDAGVRICRVLYESGSVAAALAAMLTILQEQWQEDQSDFETLQEFARRIVMDMFTIKHPSYADEREVRISRMVTRVNAGYVDPGGNGRGGVRVPPIEVHTRKGRYGDVAYIDLPLNLAGGSAMTSVGFGPCTSDEVFDATKVELEVAGVRVWRSTLPYR